MPSARRLAKTGRLAGELSLYLPGHVAAGSVEVNVRQTGECPLAQFACEAGKIARDAAVAVVALRMSGVMSHHSQRLVTVPERDQLHRRVDHAFRCRNRFGNATGTVPHILDDAVRSQHAPIRRDFAHGAHSQSDVRHCARRLQRLTSRRRRVSDALPSELDVEQFVRQLDLGQNLRRVEVAARRVVLMQTMHGDSIGRCPGRVGQRVSPGVVTAVADADPIHRAQHDRLSLAQQHDPFDEQRINDLLGRLPQSIAQRRPQRRSRIRLEDSNPQRSLVSEG